MTVDTPDILDPDSAQAYLRGWKSRVDKMAADTQAMSDRLGRLRVRGTDDNDLVEVTIDANGVLTGIRFTSRIQRVAPAAAEQAVMSAMRSARAAAARQAQEIIVETMGPDSVAAQAIAAQISGQVSSGQPSSGQPSSGQPRSGPLISGQPSDG
jgi:DNA-binding protein YbaB